MKLTSNTTVTKPPHEVYAFWHRLANLARSMAHVDDHVPTMKKGDVLGHEFLGQVLGRHTLLRATWRGAFAGAWFGPLIALFFGIFTLVVPPTT